VKLVRKAVTVPASSQGISQKRYSLIPRTLIFLTSGETVLLLKGGSQKRLWAGLYNGIGGHVERGESLLSAARRELLEETGLNLENLWLCGLITIDTGEQSGIGLFVFHGTTPSLVDTPLQASSEGILEWIPFSKVYDLPLVEDLPLLLPRVLRANRTEPPFFAQYSYDEQGQLVVEFT
jgi:8-oxo-dGTP diphosphatase